MHQKLILAILIYLSGKNDFGYQLLPASSYFNSSPHGEQVNKYKTRKTNANVPEDIIAVSGKIPATMLICVLMINPLPKGGYLRRRIKCGR